MRDHIESKLTSIICIITIDLDRDKIHLFKTIIAVK